MALDTTLFRRDKSYGLNLLGLNYTSYYVTTKEDNGVGWKPTIKTYKRTGVCEVKNAIEYRIGKHKFKSYKPFEKFVLSHLDYLVKLRETYTVQDSQGHIWGAFKDLDKAKKLASIVRKKTGRVVGITKGALLPINQNTFKPKKSTKNPIVPQDYGRVPMTKEAKRIIKQVTQGEAIQAKKRDKDLQKAIAESAKKRNAQARARYKAKKEAIALKKAQKPSIKKEETTMARAKKRTTRTLRSAIKTRRLVSYVTKKGRKIPLRKVRVATGGSYYGEKKNNAYVGKIREGLYVYKKKMA